MNKDSETMSRLKGLVREKCSVKQEVFAKTKHSFGEVKELLAEMSKELNEAACTKDDRVVVGYTTQGPYEANMTIGGDSVVFHMHTNVFAFPPDHFLQRSPYILKEPSNGYFGAINVYNFLTDSFRFHRLNDLGYLIARIFINQEGHFFVEGKQRLGYHFNDLSKQEFNKQSIRQVLELIIEYVLNFDLYTPPYRAVHQVSLQDIIELNQNQKLRTAKRMGFHFQKSQDQNIDF